MKARLLLAVALALVSASCGRRDYDNGRAPQPEVRSDEPVLGLGRVDLVPDTRFFTVPVSYGRGSGGSAYSDSRDDERNRIIVDSRTGATRRLLPDNNRRIVRWDDFAGEAGRPMRAEQVAAVREGRTPDLTFAAVVREAPRDGDKPPRYGVLLGRFDGPTAWASHGLLGVEEMWRLQTGEVAMVVVTDKGTVYRTYDPATLRMKLETSIAV